MSGNVVFDSVFAVCRPATEVYNDSRREACAPIYVSLSTGKEIDHSHLWAYSGVIVALLSCAA